MMLEDAGDALVSLGGPKFDGRPLRAAAVADDAWVRQGLRALLTPLTELELVEVCDFAGLIVLRERARGLNAPLDLVICDGPCPPTVEELAVCLLDDEVEARELWSRATSGRASLLLRDTAAEHLHLAIQAVANGLCLIDPHLIDAAFATPPEVPQTPELSSELSQRELDVLELLVEGRSNREVALALEISPNTVKFHLSALFQKLGASSRTEAVVIAARSGLLRL